MTATTDLYECIRPGCAAPPTHVLRTDRLTTVLETCAEHVGWTAEFFMNLHGRKVEPFAIALIAFHQEARTAVPVLKAGLLHEAADRIEAGITVTHPNEKQVRSRAAALLRTMAGEATA
ncbi:hypothetical protein IAG44_40010 [Streptomyces roseirectus]|uniref:Uncharacterized protein n=1 Tax=Streptomyces roseirectus TaxID=2768066 RepID=A0A7H0IQD0_9ACTN|nr:hypothetical protein [Streptomyces roseirectus]QNP74996.1 hypothetical protein IAG44_40010 [Streptomyces roseirectus]